VLAILPKQSSGLKIQFEGASLYHFVEPPLCPKLSLIRHADIPAYFTNLLLINALGPSGEICSVAW